MEIKIHTLEELTIRDIDRVTDLFMDAFHDYPKLKLAFPQNESRLAALEATLRFYIAYDMKFGKCYSLDKMVNEAILIVESDQIKYNFFRYLIAGSYSRKYINAMKRLGKEGRQNRIKLFEELDEWSGNWIFRGRIFIWIFWECEQPCRDKAEGEDSWGTFAIMQMRESFLLCFSRIRKRMWNFTKVSDLT
jgi:hypothetical protein